MKRYLLFYGEQYYPAGGWNDFRDSFDSVKAARDAIPVDVDFGIAPDWWHIIDTDTGEEVDSG